ncbi:hypothetical protein Tco_1508618 [Tanacetum coccineum]
MGKLSRNKQNTFKDHGEDTSYKQKISENPQDFIGKIQTQNLHGCVAHRRDARTAEDLRYSMRGITHPKLIKRLYEKIPRSMDEMYRVTTSFLQVEVATFNHSQKEVHAP